jgi:hemerythrin-like metal-binding protein
MSLMKWSDSMSVGVAAADADHKKLVGMVNMLFDGVQAGKGRDAVGQILDGLINYTIEHFDREERYFAQTGYPGAAEHKAKHESLKSQVRAIQEKYKSEAELIVTLETMNFLKDWLINHIQGCDKEYAPYLNEKGIR